MAAERRRRAALAPLEASGNGHGPVTVVPEAPADLEAAGQAVWGSVWRLPRIDLSDAPTVERLCRLEDEAARLRAAVARDGEVQREPIVSPRGDVVGERLVAHPAVGALRRLGKESRELGAELGLSPTSRRRLGLEVPSDPAPPDWLDGLRAERTARLREAGIEPMSDNLPREPW